MNKKDIIYSGGVLMLSFLIMLNICCSAQKSEKVIEKYTVTPKDSIIIYGVNINELIEVSFRDIEKELGSKTQVDSEMAIVFNRKRSDFVQKTKKTKIKDHIDAVYGPIEDYERYLDITPHTIAFYGGLLVTEDSTIKESIIRELQKNLKENDTTRKIIKKIRQRFIWGDYEDDIWLKINFKTQKFPLAKFAIGLSEGEVSYKYIFSIVENPYPHP